MSRSDLDLPVLEPALARIGRLARQATGAPSSRTLVAGVPAAPSSSDPFCEHVVSHVATLVVADARLDARFSAAADGAVRAFAGMPLVIDGACLGAFCVSDREARSWSEDELAALRDHAASAATELGLRRVRAMLAASEEHARSLVAAMRDGSSLRFADGRIELSNTAAEQILGATTAQLAGHTSSNARWQTIHEDGSPFADEDHPSARTLRTGEEQRDVIVGLHKPTGELTWVSITTEPLVREGEHLPYAVVCSLTDVTEQRAASHALRESERAARTTADRFAGILEAATEYSIVGFDLDGTITVFNRGAEHMLGYDADELVGQHTPALLHDPDELERRAAELAVDGWLGVFLEAAGRGEPSKREWTYLHRDGRRIPVVLTVSGIRDDSDALTGFIGIAEDITDRKRDAAVLATHLSEQEALRTVATLIASEAHPRTVFAAAAMHAGLVLGSISGAVFRLEGKEDARLVGAWADASLPTLPIGELLDFQAPTASVAALRTGRSQVAHYETPRAGLRIGPDLPLRSGAAAPIRVDGRIWGVVSVGWADGAASDPDALPRLARFADLISLAVTGSEARERLAMVASTDHLTGLANQRTFSDRLDDEVGRARRYGRPLSLILIDLDHFKLVNDTHGHDAGNGVLAELAERLGALCRGGEVIARIGGEEFAWILPETDAAGALGAAERVRAAVAATPFAGVGRLTTSVGYCALADASSARELFRHADLALYMAKSLGRNTCFRYAPETLHLLPPDEQARRLESAKTLAAVRALAAAVDAKDSSTQRHSERVATLAGELARVTGWDEARIALLHAAALVHDVGKIGIPDSLLLKTGPLSPDEFEQIKPHAMIGARMVDSLLSPEQATWIRITTSASTAPATRMGSRGWTSPTAHGSWRLPTRGMP